MTDESGATAGRPTADSAQRGRDDPDCPSPESARPDPDPEPDRSRPGDRHADGPLGAAAPQAGYWDAAAPTFDEEPDHGLLDPAVRAAWAGRLADWLPREPSDVLDLGCGTGSLALLAAGSGHRVTGVDMSPQMAERARVKLAGTGAEVLTGDAARPPVGERRFDVVMARHVLWLLPDTADVLRRWAGLVRPGGRLVLVEGVWGEASPVGLPAHRVQEAVAPLADRVRVERLSGDPGLWGRAVTDERYALVAHLASRPAGTRRASTSDP